MRKFRLYLIFFITGLLLLGFIFRNTLQSYISAENDFRIRDTAAVSRIEILSTDSIILTRSEGSWIVNADAPASQVAVSNFLFAFSRMSVKGISNKPDITEEKGIRIKIIEGRKKHLLRFYEIDGMAFMHKEGSDGLYAVEVNGFPGIKPGEIINPDTDHWKDRTLLNLRAEDIFEVIVIHPAHPENDFSIKIRNGKPVLFDGNGVELPESIIDQEKLNFYLSYFSNVFYDYTETDKIQTDSLARWILKVKDINGRSYDLMIFSVNTTEGADMFKAYVKYNKLPGYKVTRYMVLDLLLQERGHFVLN